MAPTIKEQYFGRDIQFGRDNNTASRVFHVSEAGVGVTIAQTYALEGLPQINDLHPDSNSPGVGKLYASSIARIPVGRSVMVTVSYNSLPFSGVSQIPVNPMAEGYLSVSTSFAFEKVELPAFYLSKIISPAAEGPPVEGFAWDRMEGDFEFEKVVHVFTASLNGDFTSGFSLTDFFAAGAAIRAQANKLHTFGSDQYRFVPRDLSQQTAVNEGTARYAINYTWEYDPGVPNILWGLPGYVMNEQGLILKTQPVGGNPLFVTHAFVQQDEDFTIRPYNRVQTFANIDDPAQPPKVDFAQAYASAPTGWQSLPGFA